MSEVTSDAPAVRKPSTPPATPMTEPKLEPPPSTTYADSSYVGSRYAKYVLVVLTIVYVFNFVDRQIISILAEEIKADLGLNDTQLGVLYGTVFAVFYALFGIPLGRLADVWMRKSMISIGLFFWSAMTALSGTARSFGMLLGFRVGVGIGEASASPAAFSMLSDYFSPKQRATVLSVYSSGVYIGGGIGLAIGGIVIDTWHHWFPNPSDAPLGIAGWQMAFFLVGIPGILMALWVKSLREPIRGMSEGLEPTHEPHPFLVAWREFKGIFPGLSLADLIANKAGLKVIAINLTVLAVVCASGWWLYNALGGGMGNLIQWSAMAVGIYCAFTWIQSLVIRSPLVFNAIFKNPTVMLCSIGFPCIAFVGYGSNYFAVPYLLRAHEVSHAEIGTAIGLTAAIGAWLGITIGGVIADKLKERWAHGRLLVGLGCIVLQIPFAIGVYFSPSLGMVYIFNVFVMFFSPMYIGPATSTINDLVPPQMRGTVSAIYLMMMTFLGLAMGPYVMGQISTAIASTGVNPADALRSGVFWGHSMLAIAFIFITLACFSIRRDSARARALVESNGAA